MLTLSLSISFSPLWVFFFLLNLQVDFQIFTWFILLCLKVPREKEEKLYAWLCSAMLGILKMNLKSVLLSSLFEALWARTFALCIYFQLTMQDM